VLLKIYIVLHFWTSNQDSSTHKAWRQY